MKIKSQDIGNFKNLKQAEAYKKAMSVKEQVETVAGEVMSFDDVTGVDFNDKVAGNVIVQDYEKNYPNGLHTKTSGSLKYDPDRREVESFKGEQYASMSGLPGWQGVAGCFISDNFKCEQKTEKTLFGGREQEVYIQKDFGKTEKVSIDKETGDINYQEYYFGIPKLELPDFFSHKKNTGTGS